MKTNIIAIDPSTSCTGICVNGERMVVVSNESITLSKKNGLKKWFKKVDDYPFSRIETYPPYNKMKEFSSQEVEKLAYYRTISDTIIDTICSEIDKRKQTHVFVEGYSYNSAAGNLIDLVTLSTLLRTKIMDLGFSLTIIPPSKLKNDTAKLVYEPVDVKNMGRDPSLKPLKPVVKYLNKKGVPGGKFKKPEMLEAIKDFQSNDVWKGFIDEHYSDIAEMSSVPTPIVDLNDAYWIYQCAKNSYTIYK